MIEYITFHQVSFNKDNFGIKKLFGLNSPIILGVQQLLGKPSRNPKNSNQIEIPEKINIVATDYNKFESSAEAFEVVKSFIYDEFKLNENTLENEKKDLSKDLYFYIFENEEGEETPKFRGVLYATISSLKPLYYVAFTKSLEFEYDREIYKK